MYGFFRKLFAVCVLGALAAPSPDALSTEIFRWTDENGVVHFSQVAPPAANAEVDRLAIEDDRPEGYDPEDDPFNVAEQQKRMAALREERESKRQERLERQRRQAEADARAERRRQEYEYRTYPTWYIPPLRPVRPQPPIERPEPGPGDPIRPPGVIKPPRPITPGLDDSGGVP